MDTSAILALIGSVALLAGLIGGGIEAKEIKIPPIPKWSRLISVLTGVLLIGLSIWISNPQLLVMSNNSAENDGGKLSSAKEKSESFKVLIDEYHGYNPIDSHRERLLGDIGFRFESKSTSYDEAALSDYDILVLNLSWHFDEKEDFTINEIETIRDFIRQGGSAFLIGQAWVWTQYGERPIEDYPQNRILNDFGITFTDNYVWDTAHDATPILHTPFMKAGHPIVEGITHLGPEVSHNVPCELVISEFADAVIWGDYDTEASGKKNPILVAAAMVDEGKVVAMGSDIYLEDNNKFDNNRLFENILLWLADK